jgi:hypothetical protein
LVWIFYFGLWVYSALEFLFYPRFYFARDCSTQDFLPGVYWPGIISTESPGIITAQPRLQALWSVAPADLLEAMEGKQKGFPWPELAVSSSTAPVASKSPTSSEFLACEKNVRGQNPSLERASNG